VRRRAAAAAATLGAARTATPDTGDRATAGMLCASGVGCNRCQPGVSQRFVVVDRGEDNARGQSDGGSVSRTVVLMHGERPPFHNHHARTRA